MGELSPVKPNSGRVVTRPFVFRWLRGASRPHRAEIQTTTSLAYVSLHGVPQWEAADTKTDTKRVKKGIVGLNRFSLSGQ
jgi:hypothetical protein